LQRSFRGNGAAKGSRGQAQLLVVVSGMGKRDEGTIYADKFGDFADPGEARDAEEAG